MRKYQRALTTTWNVRTIIRTNNYFPISRTVDLHFFQHLSQTIPTPIAVVHQGARIPLEIHNGGTWLN